MPILKSFSLPKSIDGLQLAANNTPLFIAFIASKDPTSKQPWCPDVRAALPTLEASFQGQRQPTAAFVEVGQRPEWKDPKNAFRAAWNVQNIPALIRYEKVDDVVKETGRLVDSEILNEDRLEGLLEGARAV